MICMVLTSFSASARGAGVEDAVADQRCWRVEGEVGAVGGGELDPVDSQTLARLTTFGAALAGSHNLPNDTTE